MKYLKKISKDRLKVILCAKLMLLAALFALLFRLSSSPKHLSAGELASSKLAVGFHGIYNSPLDLPIKFLRSIDFFLFKNHGVFLTRLPNVTLGLITIASLIYAIKLLHGNRASILAGLMFICSAWILHVSRLASYDIDYLFIASSFILSYALLSHKNLSMRAWVYSCFIWGLALTVPGLVWLVILDLILKRKIVKLNLDQLKNNVYKLVPIVLTIIWIPFTLRSILKLHDVKEWLGIGNHMAASKILKNIVAVPFHVAFRGPENPALWLGKSPLLDIFSLAMFLCGIYFYIKHFKSSRTKFIFSEMVLSVILIGLSGAVSFSLIVPYVYILIAMGLAYFLHTWLKVFPNNPVARNFGIALISIAVLLSCVYNLRAYYVAWADSSDTASSFSYKI